MSDKGCALRVGSEIWVPPNATEADIDAAWEMMTPDEQKRTAKALTRSLKWTVWRMEHPYLAAFIDSAAYCGLAMVGGRYDL